MTVLVVLILILLILVTLRKSSQTLGLGLSLEFDNIGPMLRPSVSLFKYCYLKGKGDGQKKFT